MKPMLPTFLVPKSLRRWRGADALRASRLTSTSLVDDRSGAALPEFAMAIMPVMLVFFGMVQWSIIAYVHLIVKHAAFVASRCNAVVHPHMPDAGTEADCNRKAMDLLFAHVNGVTQGDVHVSSNSGAADSQSMDTTTVKLDYKCTIPLGNRVACGHSHHMKLEEQASFPNQGSHYQQVWGI
jgi:Flp pilus assembly protein TadG